MFHQTKLKILFQLQSPLPGRGGNCGLVFTFTPAHSIDHKINNIKLSSTADQRIIRTRTIKLSNILPETPPVNDPQYKNIIV